MAFNGRHLAVYQGFGNPWEQTTLRISIDEGPEVATLKLEGRVAGPWVEELRQAWNSLRSTTGSKKLKIDLRGVLHLNSEGRHLLAEIHKTSDVEFIADTPMTKYFADEARGVSQAAKGDNR
jgi:hypothetical protein